MPIVAENDPQTKRSGSGGLGCGWIVPLLILAPTIIRYVRQSTAGWLDDQQLLIIGGGLGILAAFVLIVRQVNRQDRAGTPWPPSSTPQPSALSPEQLQQRSKAGLPAPLRFEPIVTGKVLLAGVLLGGLMIAAGAALVLLP
jgi:hypothetical protein